MGAEKELEQNNPSIEHEIHQVLQENHNQLVVVGLLGLFFLSLILAVYFYFAQEKSSSVKLNTNVESQLTSDEQVNFIQQGSRTLEQEVIAIDETPDEIVIDLKSESEVETAIENSDVVTPVTNQDTDAVIQQTNQSSNAQLTGINESGLTENDKRRRKNQIKIFCAKLGEKIGSVSAADCLSYDLIHSGVLTKENTVIPYIDFIAENSQADTKVLLFSGIHGDEFSAVSIIFKWLKFLKADQENSELGNIHWRIVPVLNPDGLLQPDGQSKRMNANNVDLNRNFPTPDWEADAIKYWQERTGSNERRYPGQSGGSEIETKWALYQLEEFKPDAVISVHAPYGIVDFDGPAEPPQKLGPLQLKLLGTYPGSMGRYIGIYKNLPMLTVELERAGSLPRQADIEQIWLDIQDWIAAKVENRNQAEPADLQSLRREDSDTNGSTVIDKKGGD